MTISSWRTKSNCPNAHYLKWRFINYQFVYTLNTICSNDIIKKNVYSWLCCQQWEELPLKKNSSEVLPIQACTTIQQQANKLRDGMLEQGIVTLFGKPEKMVD